MSETLVPPGTPRNRHRRSRAPGANEPMLPMPGELLPPAKAELRPTHAANGAVAEGAEPRWRDVEWVGFGDEPVDEPAPPIPDQPASEPEAASPQPVAAATRPDPPPVAAPPITVARPPSPATQPDPPSVAAPPITAATPPSPPPAMAPRVAAIDPGPSGPVL